jgi:hypothetical protein
MKLILTIDVPAGFDTSAIKADLVEETTLTPEVTPEPVVETPVAAPKTEEVPAV